MASRTLAGLALFALTVLPWSAARVDAQATMTPPPPTPAPHGSPLPVGMSAPHALPSPISSLPPASQPLTLPYPAYGTPVPGVNRGVPSAGVPQVVSLDQAVAIGFARSPLLAQARATVEIDLAPVDLAKTAYLPSVSGTVTAAHDYAQTGASSVRSTGGTSVVTTGLGLSLAELIWDGGKVAAELRAAKATENGAVATYKRELQTVAYNVANAYYAALAAQRATQVANETVRLNQVNADLVAAQISAGTTARSDLLTAELPVAQARVSLVKDQGAELSAQAAFVNAMGLDANTYVLPQDDGNVLAGASGAPQVAVPTYEVAIARAYMLRPDFYAQQFAIASSQANLRAAGLGLFPNLNGTGSYGTNSTDPNGGTFRNSGSIGLSLSVPIFDQGRHALTGRAGPRPARCGGGGPGDRAREHSAQRQTDARQPRLGQCDVRSNASRTRQRARGAAGDAGPVRGRRHDAAAAAQRRGRLDASSGRPGQRGVFAAPSRGGVSLRGGCQRSGVKPRS